MYARRRAVAALAAVALAAGVAAGATALAHHGTRPTAHTLVVSMPPAHIRDGRAPLVVRLSGPPTRGTVRPKINPAVAGRWSNSGDAEIFTPAGGLQPCSSYTVAVLPGTSVKNMLPLASGVGERIDVACPSPTALQRALARLGYLPYHLQPTTPAQAPIDPARAAALETFRPQPGRLVPDDPAVPKLQRGSIDEMTQGALMAFQAEHHLNADASPGAVTWAALSKALAADQRTSKPYTWVTVTKSTPQTLEVHRGHRVLISTDANTGVPGAATTSGTFPIFQRDVATTMSGTNVDGSSYSVPGVPWVSYFDGGNAIHGYDRATFGTPQSNGCVEIPLGVAPAVYHDLHIGDLVIVSA